MIQKIIFTTMLFLSTVYAAELDTNKDAYEVNENIQVALTDLRAQQNDWVAIFPADSNNDFGRIIQWQLTGATVNAALQFNPLGEGSYDVRLFYGADAVQGASKRITVGDNGNIDAEIRANKEVYALNEAISVNYENMSGNDEDWIGIYPQNSNNDWGNIVQWAWTNGDIVGNHNFEPLPVGDYEVRAFFNNSFNTEARYAFSVEGQNAVATVSTNKKVYEPNEQVIASFTNMSGDNEDWMGIYPAGSSNAWENIVDWRWISGDVQGTRSFNGLAAGQYEVRVFFDNSFNLQASYAFEIEDVAVERVLYDDFEDGEIDARWVRIAGPAMTINNFGVQAQGVASTQRKVKIAGQKSLRTYKDYRGGVNYSGYIFDFQNPHPKLKFLELDMAIGTSSHVFAFGVKVKTKFGDRRIEFASWLNHTMPSGQQIIRGPYGNVLEGHREAFTQDNYLFVHPGPSDYYVGTSNIGGGSNMMIHYKINIEEKLKLMEPENEFLGMILFSTSGGDYDNLALSPN